MSTAFTTTPTTDLAGAVVPAAIPNTRRLDLRTLAEGQQAAQVLAVLQALPPASPLLLVLDQPLPAALRQGVEAAWPDALQWKAIGQGPKLWQWRVSRAGATVAARAAAAERPFANPATGDGPVGFKRARHISCRPRPPA